MSTSERWWSYSWPVASDRKPVRVTRMPLTNPSVRHRSYPHALHGNVGGRRHLDADTTAAGDQRAVAVEPDVAGRDAKASGIGARRIEVGVRDYNVVCTRLGTRDEVGGTPGRRRDRRPETARCGQDRQPERRKERGTGCASGREGMRRCHTVVMRVGIVMLPTDPWPETVARARQGRGPRLRPRVDLRPSLVAPLSRAAVVCCHPVADGRRGVDVADPPRTRWSRHRTSGTHSCWRRRR